MYVSEHGLESDMCVSEFGLGTDMYVIELVAERDSRSTRQRRRILCGCSVPTPVWVVCHAS